MNKFFDLLKCEICGGGLEFDRDTSINEYVILKLITKHNINEKINDIIEEHMIYRCVACGHLHKVTFKDMEFLVRKELTERCYRILSRGLISGLNFDTLSYFIYCGKCKGFDGKGSCPRKVFDSCEIKRFPIDGL
jgi:hypothetical protein